MKQTIFITIFCCLLTTASSLFSEETRPAASLSESSVHGRRETRILHHLLQMEGHELARLRQTIERIEKMSPEEKNRLRKRIGAIHRMPPEKVDALRRHFKAIPREQREAMHARWMEMTVEERTELRSELRQMTPEERQAFLKEKGFLPPPPIWHEKDYLSEGDAGEIQNTADEINSL